MEGAAEDGEPLDRVSWERPFTGDVLPIVAIRYIISPPLVPHFFIIYSDQT